MSSSTNNVLSPELKALYDKYLKLNKNETNAKEMQQLLSKNNIDEIKKRLQFGLKFGTAGVRCRVQAGFNNLNDLMIIKLTTAYAQYLRETNPSTENLKVVVGYDGRRDSYRFFELASAAFLDNGVTVMYFNDVVPTPVVSYAVVTCKLHGGLMITASHNPREDNGYKVYGPNGAQIIEPTDTNIIDLLYKHLDDPVPPHIWTVQTLWQNERFVLIDHVLSNYYNSETLFSYRKKQNAETDMVFTYSAFHGVGHRYTKQLFSNFGFKSQSFVSVRAQERPDGEFPTLPNPNPEEGIPVLRRSINVANSVNSKIVLANDPDADRLQLAELVNSDWRAFTGNEMGVLLTWWVFANWRGKNPNIPLDKSYMLSSVVSTAFTKTFASHNGFRYAETLTGFKWIANKADDLRKEGNNIILAWEESIGFMPGTAMDKDGVLAACMFAEMALNLYNNKETVAGKLADLYFQYGYHLTRNSYYIVDDTKKIAAFFQSLRDSPLSEFGTYKVKYTRDLTTGTDNSMPDNKAILPSSPVSDMITYTLTNGSTVTFRGSGTEPKIKYYVEYISEVGVKDIEGPKGELDALVQAVIKYVLKPKERGFAERS